MDSTPNTFWSLCLGYSVLWGLIVLFLLRLAAAQHALLRRLERMEDRVCGKKAS